MALKNMVMKDTRVKNLNKVMAGLPFKLFCVVEVGILSGRNLKGTYSLYSLLLDSNLSRHS